jgi:hypothetical protein
MSSKPHPKPPIDSETLAYVAIHLNDPEVANNPTDIPELDQDAKVSKDHP